MPSFHPRTERLMALVGPHIRAWRVAQDLTATEVADRAGISRPTLRAIESDPTNVSFGNVLAVLAVLGVEADVFQAIDPMESPRGQALVLAKAVGA